MRFKEGVNSDDSLAVFANSKTLPKFCFLTFAVVSKFLHLTFFGKERKKEFISPHFKHNNLL